MMHRLLIIALICLQLIISDGVNGLSASKTGTIAFWNLYAAGKSYKSIVEDQIGVIEKSGLYDKLDEIRYYTSGVEGATLNLHNSSERKRTKYVHAQHNGDRSTEAVTLRAVFDYCKLHNPLTKVLYFHNKGSYHASDTNLRFRHALDCFNLNSNCIEALDKFDTCGMRLAPLPHVHYPGNYWWATCRHINKLLDPLSFQNNATIIDYTFYLMKGNDSAPVIHTNSVEEARKVHGKLDKPGLGSGRYFAEAWVGSHPSFNPADCLPLSMDKAYFNGYDDIPSTSIAGVCPNVKKFLSNDSMPTDAMMEHFGSACGGAALLAADPQSIMGLVNKHYNAVGDKLPKRLYDRSIYWYGQRPELVMKWLAKFKHIDEKYL